MRKILQICPHDGMPFAELCELYREALESLDCCVRTIYLSSPESAPLREASYLGATDLSDTPAVARLLEDAAADDWDLILCHRYRAYWAAVLSRFDNQKCVAVAHEFGMFGRWRRRVARRMRGKEVGFAGVSPAVTAELEQAVGSAQLLPNGINLPQFESHLRSRKDALAALGLHAGPFTVGFVGRLHYKKRPELALSAFRVFRNTTPDARLVFVGDGALSEDVSDEPVHVLGRVPDARYLFRAFDVLLMTSTEDEAFGMVALEAMAAGIPVATSRVPGPEFVLGDLGFYARSDSPEDYAAALAAARAADRDALADASRERVSREFSVSALARRLDDLLIERGARG